MKTEESNIETHLSGHMDRVSKWVVLIALAILPLQTQWILIAADVHGEPWEFGVARIFASALFVMLAAVMVVRRVSIPRQARLVMIVLVVLFGVWSFMHSGVTIRAFMAWLQMSVLITVPTVMWCGAQIFGLRWVVGGFLVGIGITIPFAVWQIVLQYSPEVMVLGLTAYDPLIAGTSVVQVETQRWLRAYGTLPHPNIYAGALITAMLGVWLYAKEHPAIFWLLPALAALVLFTFSRSGWAAMLVITVFGFSKIMVIAKKQFLASLAMVGVLSLLVLPQIQVRLGGTSGHVLESRSITERISTYEDAQTIIAQHKLIGTGIGRYTLVLQELFPERGGYQLQPVHNTAMLMIAELGGIGVLIFLFLIVHAMPKPYIRSRYGIVVVSVVLILGAVDHYLWSTQSGLILLGVLIGLFLISTNSPHHITRISSVEH